MAEKKLESSIRDFVDALEKSDVERALSFFADDAVYHAPEGEFKGKDEIRRIVTWNTSARFGDQKFEDIGIGLVVKGNKAVIELNWEATIEGTRIKTPVVCIYQFSDGKCVYHRAIYDRLSGAKQGATGFIARRVINTVVDLAEAGLR